MNKNRFYLLDVFCEDKYSGNQLAVVVVENNLSDEEMQQVTREFNFSETTFLLSTEMKNGGYDVRIFTPGNEVPFAGHPTLGTAYIINNEILDSKADKVKLNLKIGQIPVTFNKEDDKTILWMEQINPEFGKKYDAKDVSGIIGISEDDIDSRFPVQEVSTGLPCILIPLVNLDAVKRAKTNLSKYNSFFRGDSARPLFMFCPETYKKENQINARMFADLFGIPEDPATGSANGCLAGYLVKYRYFNEKKIEINVEQGYEMGRESLIFLKAEEIGDEIEVNVGGMVIEVAEGYI